MTATPQMAGCPSLHSGPFETRRDLSSGQDVDDATLGCGCSCPLAFLWGSRVGSRGGPSGSALLPRPLELWLVGGVF